MSDQNQTEQVAAPAATIARPSPPTADQFKTVVEHHKALEEYKVEHWGKGVAPLKDEHVRRWKEGEKVCTDGEGKTRGMNKEREHVKITGTEKPSFEGEINFLEGDVLKNVKQAIKQQPKRGRMEKRDPSKFDDDGKKESEPTAAPTTEGGNAATTSGEAQGELDGVAVTTANKERAAAWREYVGIPEDDKRDRQAKSRHLFENRTILAPLTTVGNLPYRRICKEFGVDNTVSEMAMVFNLNKTQKSEWSLLRRHDCESTFGIQLAVNRSDDAATFAKGLFASGFKYDYIDINCGCPVELICKRGCGCGLWERKGKLRDIVKALNQFQDKPVTIKCRVGVDETKPTLHNVINEYEDWGAAAVTVHGRSKRQRYTKNANWNYIEEVSHLTNLPVVGNGDVFSYADILERRELAPNVNSYMLGRGALIKPWVFTEIKEQRVWDISSHERFEMLKKFRDYGLAHWGADERGVETTRRFMCEWLSFLCRYIPVGLLEVLPQRMNDRPNPYYGRDDLETLMSHDSVDAWIKISEMLLGPCDKTKFKFTPKHKSKSYTNVSPEEAAAAAVEADEG